MKFNILTFVIFLVINFGALAIGGLFTTEGVSSTWYAELNKAPWTPPGWFFGFAWTTIMLCFSFYMEKLWRLEENKKQVLLIFLFQVLLNIGWNPLFFYLHEEALGLLVILALTLVVSFFLFNYRKQLGAASIFILPYFIWILVASSLNAYIVWMN
ncbi:TspO and MBR related proteins [Lishizhenia tianjinensis]|uniref:TspO and MBR related proteins n=1 Tax=Lishizhenia tianjinensis TaxID=477690 RepID=A0A1I7BU28_9FLAO|nr:TspO/MBR family protein [Lishizhenia tianjinensis]SFT90698.1 TspO and MBR related proteins [Lishizhenia tianjinensis]